MSGPLATSTPLFVPEGLWVVDPEASTVRFSVKHLLVATVEGSFGAVRGTVSADGSSVHAEGSVQVATIDTGMKDRDARLCGAGFFDADKHPELRFSATSARAAYGGTWAIGGDLTISGRTTPMLFHAVVSEGDRGPRIVARGPLSRREHGLDWPGLLHSGRAVVGDRVMIELDLALR